MTALLGPAQLRKLADRAGLRPSKRLGQHFVHDPNTVRRIIATAQLSTDEVVLEVGPGLGSLTVALLGAVDRVLAVEVDPLLAAALPATVAECAPQHAGKLHVLAADALRVSQAEIVAAAAGQLPSVLVANLPYNVAVPVLLHLLVELPSLRRGLVMVQAEVAQRLAAAPGSRCYGAPSVKVAWFAQARRAGPVPRAVFWPVPNVDSELVTLTRHAPPFQVSRQRVFELVDAAFAQRRKTLRAALAGWAGSATAAEQLLRAAGVDPRLRGEQLSVSDFARLAAVTV
jgi:16S rRNA (adenine1518-N6/adenine1519-N6)-dimethyltransferase